MELGEKLRLARQEAGLSQRQLCGDTITRNMLSLIEHGSARPSMDTLKVLAARLGKPVSFFLEEDAWVSPNQSVMESARRLYDGKEYEEAALVLEAYQGPDPVYDWEKALLAALVDLELAEQAVDARRFPYALELLNRVQTEGIYCAQELKRRRLLLLGRLPGQCVSRKLPSLDGELLLRAEEAFAGGDRLRAECLLEAAEDRNGSHWNLLRGRIFLQAGAFEQAVQCLRRAEAESPKEVYPLLEQCFRELGDYKQAYEYACKQR